MTLCSFTMVNKQRPLGNTGAVEHPEALSVCLWVQETQVQNHWVYFKGSFPF